MVSESEQRGQPAELWGDVSHPDGTVVSRTAGVPRFHEFPGPAGEAIPTVGIANLKDGARYGFSFRHQKFKVAVNLLDNRKPH